MGPDERFVDGGAYDGDTLRSLPEGFARAWAIEPDPLNAEKLRSAADARVAVFETALGERSGRARFDALGSTASSLSASGGIDVTLSALDDLLTGESPTYVKLDVEGGELAALAGARETLRRAQPVTAVCMYHRPRDLWEIPLFLREALPGHRMSVRIHAHDGFELVAYAVPMERVP
jgi:FkbM family methyltransferase